MAKQPAGAKWKQERGAGLIDLYCEIAASNVVDGDFLTRFGLLAQHLLFELDGVVKSSNYVDVVVTFHGDGFRTGNHYGALKLVCFGLGFQKVRPKAAQQEQRDENQAGGAKPAK